MGHNWPPPHCKSFPSGDIECVFGRICTVACVWLIDSRWAAMSTMRQPNGTERRRPHRHWRRKNALSSEPSFYFVRQVVVDVFFLCVPSSVLFSLCLSTGETVIRLAICIFYATHTRDAGNILTCWRSILHVSIVDGVVLFR